MIPRFYLILMLLVSLSGCLSAIPPQNAYRLRQDTARNDYLQRFETYVPDSMGRKVPLRVRFTGNTVVSVELDGKVIPEEEYPLYEGDIYEPILHQQQLKEDINHTTKQIEEIQQQLLSTEEDTSFAYELDTVRKTRIRPLLNEIIAFDKKAGPTLIEVLQEGNTSSLKVSLEQEQERLMEENQPGMDTTIYPETWTEMHPATREKLLALIDTLNQMLNEWEMNGKGMLLEDKQQLQQKLIREKQLLEQYEDQLEKLQEIFVYEPLPKEPVIKKETSGKKKKKKKKKRRKRRD